MARNSEEYIQPIKKRTQWKKRCANPLCNEYFLTSSDVRRKCEKCRDAK